MNTLADRGYVAVSKDTGRVTLGVTALQLAAGYERSLDLASVGRGCTAEVPAKCGETVQVAMHDGSFAVYIVRIDRKHSVRFVS